MISFKIYNIDQCASLTLYFKILFQALEKVLTSFKIKVSAQSKISRKQIT